MLFGKGGTYKSFLALDWACQLAHEGATVVYIVAEGASGMRARIHAWKTANKVEALPHLFLMPSNVALHGQKYVEAWIAAMVAQLGKSTPDLVVVDTLARNFVGGNEKDPQDMGLFVEGCERIRLELETAVLVLHHTTKDGVTRARHRVAAQRVVRHVQVDQPWRQRTCRQDRVRPHEGCRRARSDHPAPAPDPAARAWRQH